MYDHVSFARNQFKELKLSSLEWETIPGDGQKPGYAEAVIDSDQLLGLQSLAPVDMELSISVRKYPRRYFLGVSIAPDYEGELFVDMDDNVMLSGGGPIVTVILYKVDHAEFEEVFSELMAGVYDWLTDKDLVGIHLTATLKALRP